MPMRIIGRGRDAYVLAGYMQKRGKWTRSWSERYFVLTHTALHWFKKDRGQMFGEERGHFLIDSIEVTEMPEKLCFSIKSIEKANPAQTTTTLCKANSQAEYLIWAKALRDVVAGKAQTPIKAAAATDDGGNNNVENSANADAAPQMTSLERVSSDSHMIDKGSARRGSELLVSDSNSALKRQGSGAVGDGDRADYSEPNTPSAASYNALRQQQHIRTSSGHQFVLPASRVPDHLAPPQKSARRRQLSEDSGERQQRRAERDENDSSHKSPVSDIPATPSLDSVVLQQPARQISDIDHIHTGDMHLGVVAAPTRERSGKESDDDVEQSDNLPSSKASSRSAARLRGRHRASSHRSKSPAPSSSQQQTTRPRTYSRANPQLAFSSDAADLLPPAKFMGSISEQTEMGEPFDGYAREVDAATTEARVSSPPPASGVRMRERSVSSVGSAIDPLLVITVEKKSIDSLFPSQLSASVYSQMRPPSLFANSSKASANAYRRGSASIGTGSPEIIIARNMPWGQQIYVPSFEKGDVLHGVLGDGSKVSVRHDELVSRGGERLFRCDDLYRQADVLIRWQRVRPTFTVVEALNCATFTVLPLIFFALLLLFTARSIHETGAIVTVKSIFQNLYGDRGLLMLIASANAIYSLVEAVLRINGAKAQRMWVFTFVSLHGPPDPSMTRGLLADAVPHTESNHRGPRVAAVAASRLLRGGAASPVPSPPPAEVHATPNKHLPPISPHSAIPRSHAAPTSQKKTIDSNANKEVQPPPVPRRPSLGRERSSPNLLSFEPPPPTPPAVRARSGLEEVLPSNIDNQLVRSSSNGKQPFRHSASHPRLQQLPALATGRMASDDDNFDDMSPHDHDGHIDLAATDVEYDSDYQATQSPEEESSSGQTEPSRSGKSSRSKRASRIKRVSASHYAAVEAHHELASSPQEIAIAHDVEAEIAPAAPQQISPVSTPTSHSYLSPLSYASELVKRERMLLKMRASKQLLPMKQAPWGQWSEDDLAPITVRGLTFPTDKKKVPPCIPIFKLLHVDMMFTGSKQEKLTRIAERRDNYAHIRYKKRGTVLDPNTPDGKLNPLFVVNFVYPGPESRMMTITCYYGRQVRTARMMEEQQRARANPSYDNADLDLSDDTHDDTMSLQRTRAFDNVLLKFLEGTDDDRDSRFKIIARVAEGSWVVKKGVGATPAILGRKIKQTYYYDTARNIFELDVDVGSSMVAGRVLSLVKSAALSLTVDMTWILQGERSEDELPESVLGGVRVKGVDLMKIQSVRENSINNNPDYDA